MQENDDDTPQDVLARHHQKNHSNRPPQLETLSNAANYQMENHKRNNTAAQDDTADEESSDEQVRTRAPRHSKSTGEAKPDTLVYYRGTPWSSSVNSHFSHRASYELPQAHGSSYEGKK